MPSTRKTPFGGQNAYDHRRFSIFIQCSDVDVALAASVAMNEIAYMLDFLPHLSRVIDAAGDDVSMPDLSMTNDLELLEKTCDIVTRNPQRSTGPLCMKAAVRCVIEHRPLAEEVELHLDDGQILSEERVEGLYELAVLSTKRTNAIYTYENHCERC